MKRQGDKDSPPRAKRSKGRGGSPNRRNYTRHNSPHHREDRYAGRRSSGYSRSGEAYSPPPRRSVSPVSYRSSEKRREGRDSGRGSYRTILVKNFSSQISDVDIEDSLYYEYRKFGEVSVKVSIDSRGERVAYANFRSSESASNAKNAKGHLVMYDRRLAVEAVYDRKERRTRTPSPPPSTDHRDRDSYRRRSPSPLYDDSVSPRRNTPSPNSDDRSHPTNSPDLSEGSEPNVPPEDDPSATRTLFVGNLEPDITNNEIRRCLENYGRVEDVDIKRAQRGGGSYAFVRFSNLDMAYKAKVAMQGKPIVKYPTRIGYGKVFHTSKLWVGGLGSWTSLSVLEREFDRFGAIRKIDYEKGTSYAYILYESIDAAKAACAQMRGCTLPGSDTRLRIDFADPDPGMPGYEEWIDRKRNDHDHYSRSNHRDRRYYDRKDDRDRDRYHRDRPRSRERHNSDRGNGRSYDRDSSDNRGQDGRRSPAKYKSEKRPSPPRGPTVVGDSLTKGEHEFKKKYIPLSVDDADVNFKRDQMKTATDLHELCQVLNPPLWDGAFILKKTSFSVRFFLMDGDGGLVNNLITSITHQGVPSRISFLNITQRLRQEEDKLKDVNHRLRDPNCKNCILLAVPGLPNNVSKTENAPVINQQRHLRGLVKYFKEKNSAGVVTFHGPSPNPDDKRDKVTLAMLHAFPPGQFANDLLFSLAPALNPHLIIEEYLMLVVARGSAAV